MKGKNVFSGFVLCLGVFGAFSSMRQYGADGHELGAVLHGPAGASKLPSSPRVNDSPQRPSLVRTDASHSRPPAPPTLNGGSTHQTPLPGSSKAFQAWDAYNSSVPDVSAIDRGASSLRVRLPISPKDLARVDPACPKQRRFYSASEQEVVKERGQTFLYSFEGSGNTWTRDVIENATGWLPAHTT